MCVLEEQHRSLLASGSLSSGIPHLPPKVPLVLEAALQEHRGADLTSELPQTQAGNCRARHPLKDLRGDPERRTEWVSWGRGQVFHGTMKG